MDQPRSTSEPSPGERFGQNTACNHFTTTIIPIASKMSLFENFSLAKLLSRLKLIGSGNHTKEITVKEVLDEVVGEDITLKRIKGLIIEAYSALDDNKRVLLLERADRLEAQLVETYRAKGLKITADNICDTLEDHRRRHHNK